MMKQKWITEAVVLAFIPVAASIVAFAYELGSAQFYGIPAFLITLSWTSIALAIVAVIGTYQVILSWGYFLARYMTRISPVLTPKRVLVLIPFVLLTATFFIQYGITSMAFKLSLSLLVLIMFVDLIITAIEIKTIRGFWNKFQQKAESEEHQNPLSVPFNKVALAVIWSFVLLAVAWSTGFSSSKNQTKYLATSKPEGSVVLRKYGSLLVLAPFDPKTQTFETRFRLVSIGSEPNVQYQYKTIGPLSKKNVME